MRRTQRALIYVLAASVAGAVLYTVFRPAPIQVEIATVTRGRFVAAIEEDGRTRVRDRYTISSPLAGRLLRLQLKAGDAVEADQVVATIVPSLPELLDPRTRSEAQERLGAAEAAVAETAAQIERLTRVRENADADLQRATTLRQSGTVTAQQLERAQLAAHVAERELRAAEWRNHAAQHAVEQARTLLRWFDNPDPADRLEVRSPVSGRVLRVLRESAAPVSAGEPLLEVGDPSDLEVIVDVLTADAVKIQPGAPAIIEHWGGPKPLQGRVRLVEPGAFTKVSALGVEEQRVWVVIDIDSRYEQWAALGDGFRVDVSVVVQEIEDALLIPIGALTRRDGGWAVFTVENGRARERRIEVSDRGTNTAGVSSGLAPGDKVINFPPSALSDGATVRTTAEQRMSSEHDGRRDSQ